MLTPLSVSPTARAGLLLTTDEETAGTADNPHVARLDDNIDLMVLGHRGYGSVYYSKQQERIVARKFRYYRQGYILVKGTGLANNYVFQRGDSSSPARASQSR
jgi:hypothetical protein